MKFLLDVLSLIGHFMLDAVTIVLLILVAMCVNAQAGQATLAWDRSVSPEVTGYRIYYGTASNTYTQNRDCGNVATCIIPNLTGGTWFFAGKAYSPTLTSSFSNEVSTLIVAETPPPPPPPPPLTESLGEVAILSTSDSGSGNLLLAQQATLLQNASVESMSVYVAKVGGDLRLGIYDAAGSNGGPGAKRAETASFTPVFGWNTVPPIAPAVLAPGNYWLAYLPSTGTLIFKKHASGFARWYGYKYGPLPAAFGKIVSSDTVHWSLYATMAVSSGTPTPPPLPPPCASGIVVTNPATGLQCTVP